MYWIVTELFYPDEVSTAQILTDIAVNKSMHETVGVISGPIGYESSYSIRSVNLVRDISIYRVKLLKLNKNNLSQRVIRQILLSIKLSWKVFLKVKEGDTLFLTTNPTFLLLIIPFIGKIKGAKLELLVHDVFPENLVPARLIKQDSFKFALLSNIYNRCYRKVDRIIVLGEDMKQIIQAKIGPKFKSIDVIPNWSDNYIEPLKNFNISKYLGVNVEQKIVFSFAGNLGRVQGLLDFLEIFSKVKNKNLILIIIGDGALRKLIVNKIESDCLKNVIYLGSKPRIEQNFFLNACHIGLVCLVEGMRGLGVPSKTYNYLAAGKPILYVGDCNSEIDNYINDHDCGWSFTWMEHEKLTVFLKSLSIKYLEEIIIRGENSLKLSREFMKDDLLNKF